MAQPKALASLSSTLLARKGTARPAMRPQGFAGFTTPAHGADDLGWNDMGAAEALAEAMGNPDVFPEIEIPLPTVLVEREALKDEIESPKPAAAKVAATPPRGVSLATATRIRRDSAKLTKSSKAAFTLRLDAERHLRLRLASALSNISAQRLVTTALDDLLKSLPDVEALIAQLPAQGKTR